MSVATSRITESATLPRSSSVWCRAGEIGKDPRDYRVDFAKLGRLLPDFRLEYTLSTGMEELLAHYREHGFSAHDFDGDRFVRLRTLRHRLDRLMAEPQRKTA